MDPGRAPRGDRVKRYWVRVGEEEFEVDVDAPGDALLVTVAGRQHRVELTETVPSTYTLLVDGACHDLAIRGRPDPWTLLLDGRPFAAEVARWRRGGSTGGPSAAMRSAEVRSPMPGLLIAVQVDEGGQVAMGQSLVIMEAMKMQMEIRAPHAGTVRRIHVAPGREIVAGQLLVTLE